jgi:hypothetical protein
MGYLFDLRKYGFTLIMDLKTAGSFLEAGTGLVQVGVCIGIGFTSSTLGY